jgi:hypothetical protein
MDFAQHTLRLKNEATSTLMATSSVRHPHELEPETRRFYCDIMNRLQQANVPFLVGGTYASERYTGMPRRTKDLDLFILRDDYPRVLALARAAGYRTEVTAPHWLAKIWQGTDFIDVIFGSGNKAAPVDAVWFEHAVEETVLGTAVRLCPVEEMIWSKAFIMERERYDGADVIHLMHARAEHMDWNRLVSRFGPNWQVLLTHLILFQFVYPHEADRVPREVMTMLTRRLTDLPPTRDPLPDRLCRGTLLSKAQYSVDVHEWNYQDARLVAPVCMTPEELATWNTVQ